MAKDELSGADIKVCVYLLLFGDFISFKQFHHFLLFAYFLKIISFKTLNGNPFDNSVICQATCINFFGVIVTNLQAICTEAGLMALRERRMKVAMEDFTKAKENVMYRKNEGTPEGLYL